MKRRRAIPGWLLVVVVGCRAHSVTIPEPGLVVTQVPLGATATRRASRDERYPAGSRVVVVRDVTRSKDVRVLSEGLIAAGEPVVAADGMRVVFAGKASDDDAWQIYEAELSGGRPRVLTSVAGGASSPALLPDGRVVFVAPVSSSGEAEEPTLTALWAIRPGEAEPSRLTFGARSPSDPTVLADGRILFVAPMPEAPNHDALFVINNDGTGVSPYAGQHDGEAPLRRPREISGGRLAFLAANPDVGGGERIETVLTSRPYRSRARSSEADCRSIEAGANGELLVALRRSATETRGATSWGIHAMRNDAGQPAVLFDDPSFDDIEAVPLAARTPPMGRLSTVDPKKGSGQILCLDANDTSATSSASPVVRVRIVAAGSSGRETTLGDVPVAADGSFFAEVPADVALGFEALDAEGRLVRRLPPAIWVRPGESRGCIGCHDRHGRAPRNQRPLAIKSPPASLTAAPLLAALREEER